MYRKISVFLLFFLLLLSCKAKLFLSDCPENFHCKITVFKDSVLQLANVQERYVEITKKFRKGSKTFRIVYDRNRGKNSMLQDNFYTESVTFSIPDSKDNQWKNSELANLNMVYSVSCYCKGTAGDYPVKKGLVTQKADKIIIELDSIIPNQKMKKMVISNKNLKLQT